MENKSIQWFVDKWEKPCKTKISLDDFKVTIPKNLLINNQAITSIRNFTKYPWPISKYQLTVELSPQCPIGLDLVVAFFSLDAQTSNLWLTFYTDPKYVTNSSNLNRCWLQSSSLHKKWKFGSTRLQNPMAYKRSSFSQENKSSFGLAMTQFS